MGRRLEVVKENNNDDGSSVGSSVLAKPESIWCQIMDSRQIPYPSADNGNYARTSFEANLEPASMYQPQPNMSRRGSASISGSSVDGADESSTIQSYADSQDKSYIDKFSDSFQNNVKKASKQLRNMPLSQAKRAIPATEPALGETGNGGDLEVAAHGIKQTPTGIRSGSCCRRHGWYILLGALIGIVAAGGAAVVIAFAKKPGGRTTPSLPRDTPVPTLSPIEDIHRYPSASPTLAVSASTSSATTKPISTCFQSKSELQQAVDSYVEESDESVAQKYGEIRNWCVSRITDFSGLFQDKRDFNQPLDGWDLSNAVTTESMFENALLFNQNLTKWTTSSVKTMKRMFKGATSFDGDISSFDTSNVVSFDSMFGDAAAFTGRNISLWDTSRVQTMSNMFHKTQQFNVDLSSWNTSAVTDMSRMFLGSRSFNGDISTFDTSRVKSMRAMFQGASSFQGDISKWDTSAVVDLGRMFWLCTNFNSDISSWDITSAMDLSMMFRSARSFSTNLCAWRSMLLNGALTDGIFLGSGCPESSDPDLTAPDVSLCFPCN